MQKPHSRVLSGTSIKPIEPALHFQAAVASADKHKSAIPEDSEKDEKDAESSLACTPKKRFTDPTMECNTKVTETNDLPHLLS